MGQGIIGGGGGGGSADYSNGGEPGLAARTLGNTDAFPQGFITDDTIRLQLLETGEVGIGENSPTYTFVVKYVAGTGIVLFKNNNNIESFAFTNFGTLNQLDTGIGTLPAHFITADKNNVASILLRNNNVGADSSVSFIGQAGGTGFQLEHFATANVDANLSNISFFRAGSSTEAVAVRHDAPDADAKFLIYLGTGTGDGVIRGEWRAVGLRVGSKGAASATLHVDGDTFLGGKAIGLVETKDGQLVTPVDKTYTLTNSAAFPFDIDTLISNTGSGTLNITISIGGTPVTGINATAITNVQSTKTATALNSVAVGQAVTMIVSGSVSPTDYSFTLKTTRT